MATRHRALRVPTRLSAAAPAMALVLVSVMTVGVPSVRAAAIDVSSDATALHAYDTYLSALISGAPAGRRRDATVLRTVQTGCPGALSSLSTSPAGQVSSAALKTFGEEIGATLADNFVSEGAQPLRRLLATLSGLHWSKPATASAVAGLGSAERAVLNPSHARLCRDARRLAGDPRAVPPGTSAFVSRYLAATATARRRLAAFLAVLTRFQTSGEHALVARINQHVARFRSLSNSSQQADAKKIITALGLKP